MQNYTNHWFFIFLVTHQAKNSIIFHTVLCNLGFFFFSFSPNQFGIQTNLCISLNPAYFTFIRNGTQKNLSYLLFFLFCRKSLVFFLVKISSTCWLCHVADLAETSQIKISIMRFPFGESKSFRINVFFYSNKFL